MGLVAYNEIPAAIRGLELVLNVLVARKLIESGDDANRRCKIVSANPTVPARLSFWSASARLNSSRTYSVTAL